MIKECRLGTYVCWPNPGEAIWTRNLVRWVGIIASPKQLPGDQRNILAILIRLLEDIENHRRSGFI
jgi:hypothetical protein